MRRVGLGLIALLLALPACHKSGDAVLLIVVTASGSPASVAALEVTLTGGPAGSSTNRYTRDDSAAISFPTTLTAELPAYATGTLSLDVRAEDAAGGVVATGHEDAITVKVGERKTVYVQLSCGSTPCVVDGGVGDGDGGPDSGGTRCGNGRVDQDETCDTAIPAGQPGACPQSCDDHVACTQDVLTGDDCTLSCTHTEIMMKKAGDGCCPAGATASNDSDCSTTCGNNVVDPGETCDTAITPGAPGACPTEDDCTTDAPCVSEQLVSAGTCSAVCMRYPIVIAQTGDGCCPAGAMNAGDKDCPTTCGNGIVDLPGETCDVAIPPPRPGACPITCDDREPCTTDYVTGSGCQAACEHVAITAPLSGDACCRKDGNGNFIYNQMIDADCPATCGNGVVERGEACDGNCPFSCQPTPSACLRADLVGSPDDCSARCVVTEVTECALAPDGCCPAGCTDRTDGDCSPLCGDRLVETTKNEVCDIGFPPSDPSACPTSCAAKSCKDARLVSAGTCAAACMYMPITDFRPGDGCCAAFSSKANFALDPDCEPVCGNGVVERPAESCDYAVDGSCPTQDSCPPAMACTRYLLKGRAEECSASCVATPITACADGDGCCPAGCSANNDSDCTVVCGNRAVETGETCDRAITTGFAGACPRSCDDGDACTLDFGSGTIEGCTRACFHQAITACIPGDGCCPPGCGAADDDCNPSCGDGRVGAGETCDPPGSCPTSCADDGDPCTTEQLTGTAASCNVACRHVPITTCSGATGDSCCPTGCTQANDSDCY